MAVSNHSGLIETITDSISIHSIKKDAYIRGYNRPGYPYTLLEYFVKVIFVSFMISIRLMGLLTVKNLL
jgi:hypothetical protein